MSELKPNIFLGTGWGFPPTFNFVTKKTNMVSAEEDIKESLFILLSTMKSERVMMPEYGCDLIKLVFEEMDNTLYHFTIDMVKNAIILNEPRVDVETVDLTIEADTLYVNVDYIIRDTNSRHNLVYPFYIGQGTNIESHDRIY
ncbi:GPW/gp25 family protein [Lacinutrix chionoecetis]